TLVVCTSPWGGSRRPVRPSRSSTAGSPRGTRQTTCGPRGSCSVRRRERPAVVVPSRPGHGATSARSEKPARPRLVELSRVAPVPAPGRERPTADPPLVGRPVLDRSTISLAALDDQDDASIVVGDHVQDLLPECPLAELHGLFHHVEQARLSHIFRGSSTAAGDLPDDVVGAHRGDCVEVAAGKRLVKLPEPPL